MTKTAFAALALAAGVVLSTNAARSADPIAPAFDWSGPYAGIQAGYGWGSDNNDVNGLFSADLDGWLGGVHAGWNHQTGSLLLGLETDLELFDLDANIVAGGDTADLAIDFGGSIRGRVGFAADNLLIYGTAGLAMASSDYTISNGVASESISDTALGWTVGAGFEVGFSEQLSARIEYRYTDLGGETFPSTLFPGDTFSADYDFHSVRAGLSWHF
jgi:outer membrane immunogenic protein